MKIFFGLICHLLLSLNVLFASEIRVFDIKVNNVFNPIGIVTSPKFSWKIKSTGQNVLQTKYQIRVSTNPNSFKSAAQLYWDSNMVPTDQSIHILYKGKDLKSKTRYYWQVRVWDNQGNVTPWSETQYWEMGVMDKNEWTAKWIESEEITDGKVGPCPIFYKSFQVKKKIKSARLYITSHGVYNAKINGKEVTDNLFNPGWTSYEKRLQYQTYDVTSMLVNGLNEATVTVGDGWYRGNLHWLGKRNFYGKEVALFYQLEITLENGEILKICSDGSWKSTFSGAIRSSDIYNGEYRDTRVVENNLKDWKGVRVMEYSLANLIGQEGLSIKKREELKPKSIIRNSKGEWMVDFGQNLVGWVLLNVQGKDGEVVTIQHAEVLDKDGELYTKSLRSAKQQNTYVLNGERQALEPKFSFQGFRYAKISGFSGELTSDNLTAYAIYSDINKVGEFETSNTLVNQLQSNIQWGLRGNFLDIPTDCNQRDERLGWTADAQVFFSTATYNMDVNAFFKKWLGDMKVDQSENGIVPAIVPVTSHRQKDGSAGWSDAVTIIPWQHFSIYGDTTFLNKMYPNMKAWVDFVSSESVDNLWSRMDHYGDWLFYTMDNDRDGKSAITSKSLIAQVFYAASTQNLIHAAKVLGHYSDVENYSKLLENIKKRFMSEFVTPSGRMVSDTQTAYVLALHFDMLPQELRAQAAQRLVNNIKLYNYHLTTGFLGTPYLNKVLSRFGHTDVAYKLLLQETYPSWLYPVKMGATTVWERWDGIKPDGSFQTPTMNSFNHYAYGAIGEWIYNVVIGIKQNTNTPSFKEIIIQPMPGDGITYAKGSFDSPYGKIYSSWEIIDGKIKIETSIPPNTKGQIILPNATGKEINTNIVNFENNEDIIVGSGNYTFEYKWID